jgi:hypothetical protein
MHEDAAEVHARLMLDVGERGSFERLGVIREWLTEMSDFAADLDDPEFSKAVQRMTQHNLAAGEALTRRRTAERVAGLRR